MPNGYTVDAIAVLHHDKGTRVSRKGKDHQDLYAPQVTHPYLLVDEEDLPGEADLYPETHEDPRNVQTLPDWRAQLSETHLTISRRGTVLLDLPFANIPLDWLNAARAWGQITILTATPYPGNTLDAASRLAEYTSDERNRSFHIPLTLEPIKVVETIADYKHQLASETVLSHSPHPFPDYNSTEPPPPITTLREMYNYGYLPAGLAELTYSGNVDAVGFFHDSWQCPHTNGQTQWVSQMLFAEAANRACPACGPHWDRHLATFDSYDQIIQIVKPELEPLIALQRLATDETDPWYSANQAYSAALHLRGDYRLTGTSISGGEAANLVAATSVLLGSITKLTTQAMVTPPTVSAAEHGILVAADPEVRNRVREIVNEGAPELADTFLTLLSQGANLRVKRHEETLSVLAEGRDPARVQTIIDRVIDYLDGETSLLSGPLTWVISSGWYAPGNAAARLAGWWYGASPGVTTKRHLAAIPLRAARLIESNSHSECEIVAPVLEGETLTTARNVLAEAGDHLSAYDARKALKKVRVLKNMHDPLEPLGWREFSAAEKVEQL